MLYFNTEQQAKVNAVRSSFNKHQVSLAANEAIIGNALGIPLDAWRRIDTKASQLQRSILAVFNRLARASTTPVSVADLVNYYPQVSDSGSVNISLDGRSKAAADKALVRYVGTPVPVVDSMAGYGWREMEVIRKGGGMIDTQTIANHQRKVLEALESSVLDGFEDPAITVNGAQAYGLRTFPERSTFAHGADLSASAGSVWLEAFTELCQALIADNAYGQVTVFMNYSDWFYASVTDYSTQYANKTILQRLQDIASIKEIVPASSIDADELIGVADIDTGEWGAVLSAMPMTTVPMDRRNQQDDYNFNVMAMAALQLRSDFKGRSRIAHGTKS
jgi:hypothetical protein